MTQKENTQAEEKDARLVRVVRALFWIFVPVVLWWLFSSMLPGLPGPGDALRAGLRGVKHASDAVYLWVEEGKLEEAAEHVRSVAVERNINDTMLSDVEKLTEERRARLPVQPIAGDSALHEQLKSISKKPLIGGRLINIIVVGIDSRLSARDARADALHLVTVNPDSA
ncbi:MAG: hypothetical protein JXA28_04985, partial [Bacteroidetes bacterium]|nr:hypothetical protein [Bacteroidota bacterium]